MNLRCIIIDDEKPARNVIKRYIERTPYLEFVAEFKEPITASELILSDKVDLVFLDIQMPGMSGLDFIKTLPKPVNTILTTAYREFGYEGFELDVIDYLLKPIEFERFLKAVNKVRAQTSAPLSPKPAPVSEPIVLKSDKRLFRLDPAEIIYIEGMREYVAYFTESHGRIIVHGTLKELEENLPSDQFMRVHRSYVVNTSKIKMFKDNSLKIGEVSIPVSATYKASILKLFPH